MKYSKEKVREICRYVSIGMINVEAAHCADISEETFYVWKREHPEFSEALKDAELKGKASNLAYIQRAKNKSWVAAAWSLERKYPLEFALRNRIEHTGPDGRAIPLQVTAVQGMALEDMERLELKLDAVLKATQPNVITHTSTNGE